MYGGGAVEILACEIEHVAIVFLHLEKTQVPIGLAEWNCIFLESGDVNPFRMHDERHCGCAWQTHGLRTAKATQQLLVVVLMRIRSIAQQRCHM